jgi:glycosyltransferase involved in cell wall biosynthesis
MGRVTFQKGPDYLLEAAARVHRIVPKARFVMAGAGDLLAPMIERAADLGLARYVHFTGFLHGSAVDRMYRMARVFVMPSVSEPFGIAPLEALAWRIPVIVSRQSGVAEVLPSALKVDFWDTHRLAHLIAAVLKYPALYQQLRADGARELAHSSWERSGWQLRRALEEAVA